METKREYPNENSNAAAPAAVVENARTYEVRTFGCQMNVHDSERISGLLEEAGYVAAEQESEPDLVVFNTCAVRENADKRLYGSLGALKKDQRKPSWNADCRWWLLGAKR